MSAAALSYDPNLSPSTLPSPPFLDIQGVPNFRTLGYWPIPPTTRTTSTGHPLSIRPNFIYRCAQPSSITHTGIHAVNSLGIKTFYDLRSGPELAKLAALTPINEIPGTERVFCPVYKDEDYSPEKLAVKYKMYVHKGGPEGFVNAYRDILKHGGPAYKTIFTHILEKPDEPFVVHCTAGKDRTGVVCALILRLAGVSDEDIATEYSLTEKGLGSWRDTIIEKLSEDTKLQGVDREGVENMVGARRENMAAVLQMLDQEFEGEREYLKKYLGFEDEEIEKIRKNVTVEGMGGVDWSKI
jgi:protein-tyrosine phosphatase